MCRILDGLNDVAGAELMFPGTSMNTQFMYEEISKCSPGISIFGGYPGGHKLNSPEHFIFNDDEVMYDSLLLIAYIVIWHGLTTKCMPFTGRVWST